MIQILCYSCSTHIANTDVARLDWPLTGEMFTPAYPGWFLRPGPVNLDVFCPVCQQFPFSHDPYVAGGGAVGKNLNVRGADGKPVVMTVKQILMDQSLGWTQVGTKEFPAPIAFRGPTQAEKPASEFPCLSCGAKKRFHKKGCTISGVGVGLKVEQGGAPSVLTQDSQTAVLNTAPERCIIYYEEDGLKESWAISAIPGVSNDETLKKHLAEWRPSAKYIGHKFSRNEKSSLEKKATPDPHLLAMEARVSAGPERSEQPTAEDLKELERDRERRASERPEPVLRPGEGFAPQVAR